MRISFYTSYYIKNAIFLLTGGGAFVGISTKKTRQSLALHCLYLRSILEKLEYLIRPIHHKEGDRHDDVNDEEGQNSWDPRLEKFKTVTKQGGSKSS